MLRANIHSLWSIYTCVVVRIYKKTFLLLSNMKLWLQPLLQTVHNILHTWNKVPLWHIFWFTICFHQYWNLRHNTRTKKTWQSIINSKLHIEWKPPNKTACNFLAKSGQSFFNCFYPTHCCILCSQQPNFPPFTPSLYFLVTDTTAINGNFSVMYRKTT